MLDHVKRALGISTASTVFDAEIEHNITAALTDMGLTDVSLEKALTTDPYVKNAVTTYCGYMHHLFHGNAELAERMKKVYDMQKATMLMASPYTEW